MSNTRKPRAENLTNAFLQDQSKEDLRDLCDFFHVPHVRKGNDEMIDDLGKIRDVILGKGPKKRPSANDDSTAGKKAKTKAAAEKAKTKAAAEKAKTKAAAEKAKTKAANEKAKAKAATQTIKEAERQLTKALEAKEETATMVELMKENLEDAKEELAEAREEDGDARNKVAEAKELLKMAHAAKRGV